MHPKMLHELFNLENKVAVVTDCEGQLRNEIAMTLAQAGATVIIADRDPKGIRKLADDIGSKGEKAIPITADIESENSVISLFRNVWEKYKRLDILVNCAGVTANQPLIETTLSQWDECHSVNLRATFLCIREAVKVMIAAGNGGRIVTTTTVGATHPVLNGNEAYGSSRAGVTMLTKTTALDYAKDKITANVLMPGFIVGHARIHDSTLKAMEGGHPMIGPGRDERRLLSGYGRMQDIATAVLYLVGPSGGYITGQTLVMDGGFSVS